MQYLYMRNGNVSMGGNRKLFQTEGDINCVLCFWSSITKANPCPSQQFLTILNYILLKTSKKNSSTFSRNNFLSSEVKLLLKNPCISTRNYLFNLRKKM